MDGAAVTTTCPKCAGADMPVICTTCGGTGVVTLLPRATSSSRRVRLELTLDEARLLLEGRPTPETTVRLAGALERASR